MNAVLLGQDRSETFVTAVREQVSKTVHKVFGRHMVSRLEIQKT